MMGAEGGSRRWVCLGSSSVGVSTADVGGAGAAPVLGGRKAAALDRHRSGVAGTFSLPCPCRGGRAAFPFRGEFWGSPGCWAPLPPGGTHLGTLMAVCWPGRWLEHADKTNNSMMNAALGVAIWKLPSVFMYALT